MKLLYRRLVQHVHVLSFSLDFAYAVKSRRARRASAARPTRSRCDRTESWARATPAPSPRVASAARRSTIVRSLELDAGPRRQAERPASSGAHETTWNVDQCAAQPRHAPRRQRRGRPADEAAHQVVREQLQKKD